MHNLQIPTCKTLVYNPASNRQIEKNNDIIWCGVKLALKDHNLFISKWEVVLPRVLHSVCSAFRAFFALYCYKFNATGTFL